MSPAIGEDERQSLLKYIENQRDDVVKMLLNLLRFRIERDYERAGPIGDEIECCEFLARILESLGCEIDIWDISTGHRNLVGRLKGIGGGRSLILNGHADTVPVGDLSAWTHNPWGELVDDRVFGLGASDMKGGVVALVKALEAVSQMNIQLKGDVIVEIVFDEEYGTSLGTKECIKRGYMADAGLFAEPTNLEIKPVEPGMIHVRIELEGKAAHAATRYASIHAGGKGEGVNAIEKGVKIISALRDLENCWANSKSFPYLPPGINYIHPGFIIGGPGGGRDGMLFSFQGPGSFPDYCCLEYEVKWYPDEEMNQLKKEFEDYLLKLCSLDPWLSHHPPKVTWAIRDVYFPSAYTSPDHPLIKTLKESEAYIGRESIVSGFTAVSDMAWYADKGMPTALYGPGNVDQAHSVDEWLNIDDLMTATKSVTLTILDWCS